MRKKTLKMLERYAVGIGSGLEEVKAWWGSLGNQERKETSERLRKEMGRGDKERGLVRNEE